MGARIFAREIFSALVSIHAEVGVAMHLFIDDNDDWLPPGPVTDDTTAPLSLDLTEMPDYNVS
jgi:hypothetical protein